MNQKTQEYFSLLDQKITSEVKPYNKYSHTAQC